MPVTPAVSDAPRASTEGERSVVHTAAVSRFTFLVCYFRTFIFPDVPIMLWGDHLGFFYDGSRIVGGELPYRDYFQIVPPGTELTYALLIRCFGLSAWIPNLVMALLAAALAWMITVIAQRFMVGAVSLLPALLFAGFILHGGLDPTHHWFSTVAVMAALLVLLEGTGTYRVVVAGVLCGLAACFTQTKGAAAVAAFIVYFVWQAGRDGARASALWRKCLLLCVAAASIFFALNAYFIQAAGLRQWLFCILVYPLRYYTAPPINNWRVVLHDFQWHGGPGRWISYPFVYATVPLVYFIFLFTMRKQWKREQGVAWDQLLLVTLTGLGMFLAIAGAPSLKRLSSAGAPAMVLLAWLLNRPGKAKASLRVILGIAAIAFAVEVPVRAQMRWHDYLDLPAGRMAFIDPVLYEEYGWVLAYTHPGQFFFGMPPFYTAFELRNPAAVDGVDTTEYTRPEQVVALIQALETHPVPLIILRGSKDFPQAEDSPSDHSEPFRAYLLKNYRHVRSFPVGDEVWEKN
jgi:hypothetical protein